MMSRADLRVLRVRGAQLTKAVLISQISEQIKLALIDGKKVTEFKAQGEKEIAKEKAKIERLAKMQAEKAERDRIKEEEKAQRAAAREARRAKARRAVRVDNTFKE